MRFRRSAVTSTPCAIIGLLVRIWKGPSAEDLAKLRLKGTLRSKKQKRISKNYVYSSQIFFESRCINRRFFFIQTNFAVRTSCSGAGSLADCVIKRALSNNRHAERIEPAVENGQWSEGVSSRCGTGKTGVCTWDARQLLGLQRTNARSDA